MHHLSFTAPGMVRHKMGITTDGHCPCVSTLCLLDVTAFDQISQAFPSVYAYCKQSNILEVGMAWERDYMSESHHQHFKIILFGCVYIVNSCCSLLMNATSKCSSLTTMLTALILQRTLVFITKSQFTVSL